ncbi:MAG: hypothetical protein ABEJ26_13885 [Halosimplex sp.]
MLRNRPVCFALLVAAVVLAPVTHVAAASAPASAALSGPVDSTASRALADADPQSAPAIDALGNVDGAAVEPNTSNYLGLRSEAVERTDFERAGLDVGGAIQRDVTDLHSEYAALTFERRLGNTTGRAARLDVLRAEVDRLEGRVQELEIVRNRAIDAYNGGDIGTVAFVRRLAALDAAARGVDLRAERIREAAGLALPSELGTKLANLEADLLTLRGPVRHQIARAMSGARQPVPVYAVTSETGIVLASTTGSQYYREAYLGQNRKQIGRNNFVSGSDPSGISTANSRATQLYPWVYDNIRSGPNVEIVGNTSVYYVELGHPQGSLDTYLDGRSEDAYREFQVKSLPDLPTRTTRNVSRNVRLQVNRTHSTGPMEVGVTDNLTGRPLEATVSVNGVVVGSTGEDGRLWTLTPHQTVRIQVTTADNRTVRERFFAG